MTPPVNLQQIHKRFEGKKTPSLDVDVASKDSFGVYQTTLGQKVSFEGGGLHTGTDVSVTLCPAFQDTGIVFVRTDIENPDEAKIPALYGNIRQTKLCSTLGNVHGHVVVTVEHLMAAFAGLGVDNVVVEIHGSEIPAMDGSAQDFVSLIERAGLVELPALRHMIRILKPVRVEEEDKVCELLPLSERGHNGKMPCDSIFEAVIDFDHKLIGKQKKQISLIDKGFKDLADARTFGMLRDAESLHAQGLALGSSFDNAIILDDKKVLNENGLRSKDEFVRHKLLDAVGDIYLAGLRMIGIYRGYKAGHVLHNKVLHALFAEPYGFEVVTLAPEGVIAPKAFVPKTKV